MKKFLIVIEKAKDNYSAYSPDLQGMKEDHIAVPKQQAISEYLVVA